MLPARERQHEVVQNVRKRRTSNGDTQVTHGGEVGQAAMTRRMLLREEHFLRWSFQRTPAADVPLQGAQHAIGEAVRMIVLQLAQQRNRHQLRGALQQRHYQTLANGSGRERQ
jgi:hypothetical protein